MAEIRRGTAMLLLTAGDKEISTALANGILAVRLPMAKPFEPHEAQAVSAEIRRQREFDLKDVARKLRQEMHPEPVDYAMKVADAELDYGEPLCVPGPLERFGARLLLGYALVVLAFDWLFKSVGT